jgi:ribosomal protein L24
MQYRYTFSPGDLISIIGGTYKGDHGHVVKVHPIMCTVALTQATSTYVTRVNLSNVAPLKPPSTTTLADAIDQDANISTTIDLLCTLLANTGLAADDLQVLPYIHLRLAAAVHRSKFLRRRQTPTIPAGLS